MARSFGRIARETRRATYRRGDAAPDHAAVREWAPVNGFTVMATTDPRGWRAVGTRDEALQAFGLVAA